MKKKSKHTSYSFLKRVSAFVMMLPFFFYCSCTFTVKDNSIPLDMIKEYLGTNEVQLLYSGDDRAILITKLAEVGLNPTEDTNSQLKTLSSVTALTLSKELLEKKPEIKYITVKIDESKFDFNIEDLKAVNNYLNVIEQYFKLIRYNTIDTNNTYLSDKIPVESQESLLIHLNQFGEIDNFNLLKYEVVNGKLQVFINMIFKGRKSLPFAFIFLLDDDNRIDGIQPVS